MLARTRKALEEKEQGFTLIELLVVIVIIGILAAIAVPTFLNQREKAWARALQSDLRNAAVVAEEFYSENGTYVGLEATDFRESGSVERVYASYTTATNYCLSADSSTLKGVWGQRNARIYTFANWGVNAGKPISEACGH